MGVERTDRARDSRQALFHEIRRSLNGAVLQVEVARLDPGHSARSAAALNSTADQLIRLAQALEALEKDLATP